MSTDYIQTLLLVNMHRSLISITVVSLLAVMVLCEGNDIINVTQNESKSILSKNYPMKYDTFSNTKWKVHAEEGCVLMVEFEYFSTEDIDVLWILDQADPSRSVSYSGVGRKFTPYISKGSNIVLSFLSSQFDADKGFNLTVRCHLSEEIYATGLHSGGYLTAETINGLVKIEKYLDGTCEDGWNIKAADVVCREAGYPGAYSTSINEETSSRPFTTGKTFHCNNSHFRLQDCESKEKHCQTFNSASILCNAISFVGCYDFGDYQQNFTSSDNFERPQCLKYCKDTYPDRHFATLHQHHGCACFNRNDVDLTALQNNIDKCRDDNKRRRKKRAGVFWVSVYDISVGFCEDYPALVNGKWSPIGNETSSYLGSKIYASCSDGYVVQPTNNRPTLTCKPVLDPSFPKPRVTWQPEDKISICVLQSESVTNNSDENNTSRKSDTSLVKPTLQTGNNHPRVSAVAIVIPLIIIIFLTIVCVIITKRRKNIKRVHLPCMKEGIEVCCLESQREHHQDMEQVEPFKVTAVSGGFGRTTAECHKNSPGQPTGTRTKAETTLQP